MIPVHNELFEGFLTALKITLNLKVWFVRMQKSNMTYELFKITDTNIAATRAYQHFQTVKRNVYKRRNNTRCLLLLSVQAQLVETYYT